MLEIIRKRKEQLIEHSNYFENNSVKSQILENKNSKQSEFSMFGLTQADKGLNRTTTNKNFRIINENQIEFVNLKKPTPNLEAQYNP